MLCLCRACFSCGHGCVYGVDCDVFVAVAFTVAAVVVVVVVGSTVVVVVIATTTAAIATAAAVANVMFCSC